MALLTPIAKAFVTEAGYEAANHGVQIYGGHGFIREWGMEQIVRDARIAMLYEGTTGIQSLDLLGRKVLGFRRSNCSWALRKLMGKYFVEEHERRER
jgi:alkylation response protein AidB-like acyl-CoA dehydrogenase